MKNLMKRFLLLSSVVMTLILGFSSCDSDEDDPVVDQKFWVSSAEKGTVTAANAKALIQNFDVDGAYSSLLERLEYDIKIYAITYKTKFQGDTIEASGIVVVPTNGGSYPIMSFQHGTIATLQEAPSVSPTTTQNNLMMSLIASAGYIVFIPDYIGYGESSKDENNKTVLHPYLIKESTVSSVLDFIRAGKEFVSIEKPAKWNNKLFLAGYSQGGYATLAALSAIENDVANSDIEVTATSCGSGPYDINLFRGELNTTIMTGQGGRYETPWTLAFLAESYKEYAGVDNAYDVVFKSEYASKLPLVNGVRTSDDIDEMLPEYIGYMLTDEFLDDATFSTSADFAALRTAFNENSIEPWALKSKVAFFYGMNDVSVPSNISVKTARNFKNIDGNSSMILEKPLSGMDHFTAILPTMLGTIDWFKGF